MPDVPRTVARTTSLLARIGYTRQAALHAVLAAARAAAGKVSPDASGQPSWLDQLALEAEARLRVMAQPQSTRKDGEPDHASTT